MDDKELKNTAKGLIDAGLKLFYGEMYVKPPKGCIHSNEYKKLHRLQIDQGVVALVLACNLSGGSVGNADLYKLVQTYLWDDDARAEINSVIVQSEVSRRAALRASEK